MFYNLKKNITNKNIKKKTKLKCTKLKQNVKLLKKKLLFINNTK